MSAVPPKPRLTRTGEFWYGVVWSAATVVGLVALVELGPWDVSVKADQFRLLLILSEVLTAGAGAVSSFLAAFWATVFYEVELIVPNHARAGKLVACQLRLLPYASTRNVSVRMSLKDQFFEKDGQHAGPRKRRLASFDVIEGRVLPGAVPTELAVAFEAPFPITAHTSLTAETLADVSRVLSYVMPGLRLTAENMKEFGGYYVEARVRVGIIPRTYRKRLITYFDGSTFVIG